MNERDPASAERRAPGRAGLIGGLAVFLLVILILTHSSVTSSREPSSADRAAASQDRDRDSSSDEAGIGDTVAADEQPAPAVTDSVVDELVDTVADTLVDSAAEDDGGLENVLVIGGSSLAGLEWNSAAKKAMQGADFTFDLESCRRLYLESCSALRDSPPTTAYEVLRDKGPGHTTAILMGGYNDSGSRFKEGFEKVIEKAREVGIERFIMVTLRVVDPEPRMEDPLKAGNFRQNNYILDDLMATGDYPDVFLADWNLYAGEQDHWFSDKVHFSALGAWGAADYLSRKLAFLDKRACPQPRRPGDAPQDPCPDPDRKPPDVDFQNVYKFKRGRLLCYDVSNPDHIECKPPADVDSSVRDSLVLENLEYGDKGDQVRALQEKLRTLDIYEGSPTGTFDDDTLAAVMRFQFEQDLPITGNVGPATRDALGFGCADTKLTKAGDCPADDDDQIVYPWTPRRNDRGIEVRVLQLRLVALDYLDEAEGIFGARTTQALEKFQEDEGLDVTGEADEPTLEKLGFEVP